jgi:hypothetical protein
MKVEGTPEKTGGVWVYNFREAGRQCAMLLAAWLSSLMLFLCWDFGIHSVQMLGIRDGSKNGESKTRHFVTEPARRHQVRRKKV